MKDLTLTQEYLICAVNDKGVLSSYNLDAGSCLIASGILEMQMEGCISIQEKKVSVCGELPEKLKYLQPLYNVIHQGKPVKLEKILDTYMISFTNKKLNELVDSIMNALKEADAVTMVKAGILGNKENYAPKKESVNRVIDKIRAELLEDGEITEDVIALTALLEKAGRFKEYFSRHEQKQLKDKLKEIKNSEAGKTIGKMVNYIDGLFVCMIATTAGAASN